MISIHELRCEHPYIFNRDERDYMTKEEYITLINEKLMPIFYYFDKSSVENYNISHFAYELTVRLNLSMELHTVIRILEIIKFHNDRHITLPKGEYHMFAHPSSTGVVEIPKDDSHKHLTQILGFPKQNVNRSYRSVITIIAAFNCYYLRETVHIKGPVPDICFSIELNEVLFPEETFSPFDYPFGDENYDIVKSEDYSTVDINKTFTETTPPISIPIPNDNISCLTDSINDMFIGEYHIDDSWTKAINKLLDDNDDIKPLPVVGVSRM